MSNRFTLDQISRMSPAIQAQVAAQMQPAKPWVIPALLPHAGPKQPLSIMPGVKVRPKQPSRRESAIPQVIIPSESASQRALIIWWRGACTAHNLDERLLMAFPLAGIRSPASGGILKAEGMRAGTPDLLLAVVRGDCAGLWIEMKTIKKGSTLRQSQKEMLKLLSKDYATVVCRSTQEAQAAISAYLKI